MLAVVEQHYHSPVGKLLHNGRRGGPGAGQREAKRCRGSRGYQPPVPDPRQVNEPHAVGDRAGGRQPARDLNRQPRLAGAAGPAQGQQP
jgi:hypothetical protein